MIYRSNKTSEEENWKYKLFWSKDISNQSSEIRNMNGKLKYETDL